jgi:stress-induced-phosphoprotein 1
MPWFNRVAQTDPPRLRFANPSKTSFRRCHRIYCGKQWSWHTIWETKRYKKCFRKLTRSLSDKPAAVVQFREKAYNEAIYQFTSTIAGDAYRVSAYSNRAACYTATKEYKLALKDAEMCVHLKPNWPKSYYRLGRALYGIGEERTGDAVEAFAKGVALDPASKDMRTWHKTSNVAWMEHIRKAAKKPQRTFDTAEFDKLVKTHEEEEKRVEDEYEQEERVKAMKFEKPDGTEMTHEEMERMLGGLPDPKDRGDAYRARFNPAALKRVVCPWQDRELSCHSSSDQIKTSAFIQFSRAIKPFLSDPSRAPTPMVQGKVPPAKQLNFGALTLVCSTFTAPKQKRVGCS